MYKLGAATSVSDVLAKLFNQGLVAQANREAPFLNAIVAAGRAMPYMGKASDFRIKGTGATASAYASGASAASATEDSVHAGTVAWARYETTVSVADDVVEAARAGSLMAVDEFGELLADGVRVVAKQINAALYTGDGTSNTIVGLATAVDGTGDYAGLGTGDLSIWKSTEVTDTGTFALDNVDSMQADISVNAGFRLGQGDFFLAYPTVWQRWDKLQAAEGSRTQNFNIQAGGNVDPRLMNIGGIIAGGLSRHGVTVVEDSDAPTDTVYGVSSRHIGLRFMPFANVVDMNGREEMFWVKRLGATGHFTSFNISAQVQFYLNRRNACGKYTGFTLA